MANYRKILLATDFSDLSEQTVERAVALAGRFDAVLGILHVVEPPPISDPGSGVIFPFDFDLTEQMLAAAREHIAKFAEDLRVPKELQWVEVGSPKAEIVRVATEEGFDLIVIGTHGRHGIGLLLGSTAASVVHHASCDVLTVRLKDE